MLKVALVGCWHPHVSRYYPTLQKRQDTLLSCLWDSDSSRGQEWSAKLGVSFVADYRQLLKRPDVDAVCITSETSMHKELMIAAANAGKHIFTEKTLAITLKDAEEIRDTVKRNGVKFSIAYIRACTPPFILGKELAQAGLLGDINMVRIRNGVNTTQIKTDLPDTWFDRVASGGGAMIDLGSHQMYLMDWMLGEAIDVSGNSINYFGRDMEDNVCCVLRFKNGALGVAESTWSTFYSPYMYEIYGRNGSFIFRIDSPWAEIHIENQNLDRLKKMLPSGIKLEVEVLGGTASNASAATLFGTRTIVKVLVEGLPLCHEPLDQWIDGCVKGTRIQFDIDAAVRLTKLLEGCNIAIAEKRTFAY